MINKVSGYDMLGREFYTHVKEFKGGGTYTIDFDTG